MARRSKGEGTIYFSETLDRWVAQITLPTGKKKTKYGKTQKIVRDWLQAQKEAVSRGVYVESENVTLGAFLEDYMTSVASTLRPKTQESYFYLIRKHITPELGRVKLNQLRPDQLQALYTEKLKTLSPRTVAYIHAVLHKSLNQALRWGLVSRNVSDLVDPPSVKKPAPEILNMENTKRFMEAVEGHRWQLIYLIAIGGGLREGEILALTPSDCDTIKGIITITKALQYLPGRGLVVSEPKTQNARRKVKLPDFVLAPLKDYLDSLKGNQKFLFETANGTPISPRNLLRHFHQTLVKLGLPVMPFHSLRHLNASLLLISGANPRTVMSRLGHSTVTLTLNTYSHLLPGVDDQAADNLNKLMLD